MSTNSPNSSATDVLESRQPGVSEGTAAGLRPAAVCVSKLEKRFGPKAVLDGVDLNVAQGSSLALIGANGSGKSTLLRCMIRLIEPDAGGVNLLGVEIAGAGRAELKAARARVGFIFQQHNLVSRLSALSNVVHGVQSRASGPCSWFQSLASAPVREEAMYCLERVGLAAQALQRVDSLSGGQSQRVAIARVLMQRPEIVLADEPDASLDPRTGQEIMQLLFDLTRANGAAMIVVSHRMQNAIDFSDRIVGLDQGRIVMDINAAYACENELTQFFGEAA
jgi:phosphonate transport system ATP-binding protein